MARDEATREVLSEAQLAAALTAYRECEAAYLYPATDEERERAAINGFWNARNIIPALLAELAAHEAREARLLAAVGAVADGMENSVKRHNEAEKVSGGDGA